MHDGLSLLAGWSNFYVIVGSSAAALTGLQFVVMAVVADLPRRSTPTDVDAFGTPTILHFGAVLLVAAIATAPWPSIGALATAFAACGFAGVIYVVVVIRRTRTSVYRPVAEDWIWHVVVPIASYGLLAGAATALPRSGGTVPLFIVGGCSLLLLFAGIHNAWDTVTYLVIDAARQRRDGDR